MPFLLLIRHGENEYTKTGKMAGHTPGVHLNERGEKQARELAEALKDVPISAIYSSPLERAMETAQPIAKLKKLKIHQRAALIETKIGKWQGMSIRQAAKLKAWKLLQQRPSRFRFPGGESILECQTRLISGIDEIISAHKPQDVIALVFHADPIKLVTTYYLGMPLDNFQRIAVDTASVTVMAVGESGAALIKQNARPPFKFEFGRAK